MHHLIRKLVKEVLEEIEEDRKAPTQFIDKSEKGEKEEEEENEIDEMSVAANVAGPILPFGMSPDDDGESRRRKTPRWK